MRHLLRLLAICAVGVIPAPSGFAASLQAQDQQQTSTASTTVGRTEPGKGKEGPDRPQGKPPYEVERQMGRGGNNSNGTFSPAMPHPDVDIGENTEEPKWSPPDRIKNPWSQQTNDEVPDASELGPNSSGPNAGKENKKNPTIPAEPPENNGQEQGRADPGVIAACVAWGSVSGLIAGPWLVWRKFRHGIAGRPYGDVSRGIRVSQSSRPWLRGIADPTIFQPELALRDKLISQDELRSLRSRYLVTGNFSFSMILPTLLGIYLASVNTFSGGRVASLMRFEWTMLVSFLVSTFLSSYALDQRHKFRAEYRLVVRKGWEQARAREGETPLEISDSNEAGAAGAEAGE